MAKEKFVPVNGAYNITSAQKDEFTQFLRNKIKQNNKFTPDGRPSKAGVITKTYIDGKLQQFRNRSRAGVSSVDGFNFASQTAKTTEATKRAAQIKKNRPTDEVFDEAGKLWDELVGDKGSFTMGDKTFTSKEQYQKFESKRHNQLTRQKEHLNRKGGTTHGHAVPPKHKFAVESYMQSFPEDASANYASQDKVPADFEKRLDKAGVPKDKTTVAKRHVGTEDLIKDLPKDAKVEKILKTDSQKALKFIKAKRGFKFIARKSIPYVGGALALSSFGGSVHAMQKEGLTKKTGTDLAFRTADLALEGVDALTGGLSTPVTLALQLALAGAEHTINQGAAKVSTRDRKKFR